MGGTIGLKAVFTADDKMSGAVRSMTASIKGLSAAGESLGKLDQINGRVWDKLKMGAIAGATALGLVGGAIAKNVVESGADFEQSITNVGAVMGKNRGQISELEKTALSLGVSTQFSATQVSEGMEMMAKKGFDAEEILGGIPGVLNAVAASGEGMAEVSTIVGSSIRGFGLEAKDAGHVADVLAYAAEKTGSGIINLGTSMAIAAPSARALGVSLEDTAAATGLLQKMGLDASTAGSATATMLTKIAAPSKEAAQEMAALGIKFQDAKGNMLPFTEVLKQFVHAGDKAGGNMARVKFFADLVGLRGEKAGLALSELSKSGDFDKLAAGLKNTGGYAERVAKIRLDTTAGSWKLLASTVEVLEIKLFSLGNVGLRSAIDKMNLWVQANGDLIATKAGDYINDMVGGIGKLVDNIDLGVSVLGHFKDGVSKAFDDSRTVKAFGWALKTVFGGEGDSDPRTKAFMLGEALGDLGSAFIGYTVIVKGARAAVFAFEIGMKAARGIMIAYEAVAGFVTGTIGLYSTLTGVGAANTVALGGAMTAAGVEGGEMAIGVGEADAALVGLEAGEIGAAAAAVPAETGIAGIGLAAGAAIAPVVVFTAMLGSLLAVAYNLYELYKESGGAGGMWSGIKGFAGVGTKSWGLNGYNQGVDSEMNSQARERRATEDAAAPGAPPVPIPMGVPPAPAPAPGPWAGGYVTPGMAPPPAPPPMIAQAPAITPEALHAAVSQALEVTVKADAGTTAEVTKKPKGAKVNLTASGAP